MENNNIHSEKVETMLGKIVRVYTEGDAITADHNNNRVNVERSKKDETIIRVWQG